MITKLTVSEFVEFQKDYDSDNKNQRFGQAFLNKHYPEVLDSELFYQDCRWICIGKIWADYIEVDEAN